MGSLSLPHLLVVALIVLVLFGRGRISEMMGDFGKGIKSFKAGINEESDRPVTTPPAQIAAPLPAQQPKSIYNGEVPVEPGTPPRT